MLEIKLPQSIHATIDFAAKKLMPIRIVLFGSRARGDARENSDFDIAVFLSDQDNAFFNWAKFIEEFKNQPITLFTVDWILASSASECSAELLKKIQNEGITVYERKP